MSKMKLSIDRLTPGLYIKLPCPWSAHPFLFGSFKIQDKEQVKVLQSLDFQHVLFYPEKSDCYPLPVNAEKIAEKSDFQNNVYLYALWTEKEQRVEEQQRYIHNLRKCENDFKQSLSAVRAINMKLENQASFALEDAKELVGSIISKLNNNDNAVLHLMEEGKEGDKYHCHVFHVSILALMLGKALELSVQELTSLGLGALFHDLGKSKIPNQILYNNPNITAAEKNYLKLHVRYALDKISYTPNFPAQVTEIISQHHEYLDGSGYPQKLSGEQINLLTQIVTIANEYDNLCNPMDKHPARTPYHALSYLYKHKNKQLNQKVLGLLVKELGIYPPGSIVLLCNEKIALVISVSRDNILQPNVMIYEPSVPKNNAPIISLGKLNLKIEKVILPSKLPENIREYLNPRARINYYFEHNE